MFCHATGRLAEDEKTFVPDIERRRSILVARIYVAIYLARDRACLAFRSILPAMYIGLPSFYGGWMTIFFGLTQHAGLAEDVLDHRLNSRTVYMNPIFRFLYWNMNYHVEHHMFPMVPYHALPGFTRRSRRTARRPIARPIEAYREIIPTILRQRRDPSHKVRRPLPPGAGKTPVPVPPRAATPLAT